jgi:hypothetical protein
MENLLNYLSANPWALWLALGVISLVLSKQSQFDEWANSRPRLAGMMKLLRGLGLDPFLLLQSLSLIIRGRLPDPPATKPTSKLPPLTIVTLALVCIGLSGCAALGSTSEPCSEASLAGIVAECQLRIERECPRDQDVETCQALKDCDAAVSRWEACK